MQMNKGCKLYVRIDYRTDKKGCSNQDFQDHLAYVKDIARKRYFIGGGFSNVDGGMILLEAKNLEEAQMIAQNDPIIERGFYRCDLFVWDLLVLSEDLIEGAVS